MVDLDDFRALRSPPARDVFSDVGRGDFAQSTHSVIVVFVMTAGVLNAPGAGFDIEFVGHGYLTFRVGAPTTSGLTVSQAGMTVAQCWTHPWTTVGQQVGRAVADG